MTYRDKRDERARILLARCCRKQHPQGDHAMTVLQCVLSGKRNKETCVARHAWLRAVVAEFRLSTTEAAALCGVNPSTVAKALKNRWL